MISRIELEAAAQAIRSGELVAFPTETVYGLGANALDPAAVARIFEAKGRPHTSPLIVHVASAAQARELVIEWPREAELLAERFWPGPLTLIFRKSPAVPDIVTAGLDTVALRVPADEIALALIRESGVPIAAPSANRFTELSPTRAEHVRASLGDRVAIVLDGGPTQVGIESTVIALGKGRAELLRPGMISREQIEAVIGPVAIAPKDDETAQRSPGRHARHYRPRTQLVLGAPLAGKGAYLYWSEPLAAEVIVAMPCDAAGYAARLYDVLHDLDARGLEWIAVEPLPDGPEWDGIRDRLHRAAYVTVEEYLRMSFKPNCEYNDGLLRPKSV
jgi:L-threonylcarbamoyladenylate synthase